MARCLELYNRHGFEGVMIPDHTPHMECEAGWHAGMAFAFGVYAGVDGADGVEDADREVGAAGREAHATKRP